MLYHCKHPNWMLSVACVYVHYRMLSNSLHHFAYMFMIGFTIRITSYTTLSNTLVASNDLSP